MPDLDGLLGGPVLLEELKRKPGRRRTFRAVGSERRAIVKVYASERAETVAARVSALAGGPDEPRLPVVLLVDAGAHTVVLSEVQGVPLREAILRGDADLCARAGVALGRWHGHWAGRAPAALAPHTAERELELLEGHIARASLHLAAVVSAALPTLLGPWTCSTAVHRDLYEEQILIGPDVGLIDLDDAALGPPELDLGNLWAHLELLAKRAGRNLAFASDAVLAGYRSVGPPLDTLLLARCRALTLLRLACIHRDDELVELASAA